MAGRAHGPARSLLVALAAALLAVVGARVWAQGGAAGGEPPFADLSLEEALALSRERHRFLVVYPRGQERAQPGSVTLGPGHSVRTTPGENPFELMERHTWRSPTLRAWLEWHAITVRVDQAEHPEDWARVRALVPRHPVSGRSIGREPVVLIFKDGELFRTVPDERFRTNRGGLPIIEDYDPGRFYIKPLQILLVADLALSTLESTDPVWHAMHSHKNPPPERPGVEMFHGVGSAHVDAVDEALGAGRDLVLARWREARESVEVGGTAGAIGLYTWLWERGRALDPDAGPALRVLMVDEMRSLAERGGPAQERFGAMYLAHDRLAPWFDGSDMHDLILLSEAAHREFEVIEYFSVLMPQDDTGADLEASVFSVVERAEIDLVTSRGRWSGLDELRADATAWLTRQARLLGAARPRSAPADRWEELQSLRRRLIADESCRHYVAALRRGDEAGSVRIADVYLGLPRVDGEPDARVALVICALAAGEARASHPAWLDAASSEGADRPDVRAWAEAMLGGR